MDNNFGGNNGNNYGNGYDNNNANNYGNGYDNNNANNYGNGYDNNNANNYGGGFNNNNYGAQNYDNNQNFSNQNYNEFNGGNFNYSSQQPGNDPGHGLAIASLVLGIISLLSCCCAGLGIITGIVGIILAIVSKSKSYTGCMETLAKVGLALSIVGLIFSTVNSIAGVMMSTSSGYESISDAFMEGFNEGLESADY